MPTLASIPVTEIESIIQSHQDYTGGGKQFQILFKTRSSPAEDNGHVGKFVFLLVSFQIFENFVNLSREAVTIKSENHEQRKKQNYKKRGDEPDAILQETN